MVEEFIPEVTCSAPVNIAVIKYWGKRDTQLNLPTNSSLSVTLNQDHLKSTTTIRILLHGSPLSLQAMNNSIPDGIIHPDDLLSLNEQSEVISQSKRLRNVIGEARKRRLELENENASLPKWSGFPLQITSVNNFPTAAGLASSASGFACLTYCLAQVYQLPISLTELSKLARLGSGSACRSMFGGFVAWESGTRPDGMDSMAVQVASESHWPDLEALILVVSSARKETGSTVGMQHSVETSALLQHRIQETVPDRMKHMKNAISSKDFDTFAELTMADSNQFHAICLDTFPPIFYMNDISRTIIRLVNEYNRIFLSTPIATGFGNRGYKAAYTFDAGPNAVVYLPRENVSQFLHLVNVFFPPSDSCDTASYFGRAQEFLAQDNVFDDLVARINMKPLPKGSLSRIISTSIGDGPRVLKSSHH